MTENAAMGGGLSGFVSIVQYNGESQNRFGIPAYLDGKSSGFCGNDVIYDR